MGEPVLNIQGVNQMKRSSLGVFLVLMLLVSLSTAKEAPKDDLFNVQEHTLENGMRLLMMEDHSAPLITYQIFYHVGSRNERPGITGMAHQFEHLMFLGSKKYGPTDYTDIIKSHGGVLNAGTWYDRTAYYEIISSDNLELAIHMEAERQANLKLEMEPFLNENLVIQEERRQRVDNSLFGQAREELMTNSFRAHPYNWPVIGWMSDIQNYRMEDLKWFYKTFYAPNNATIILAGDFDPDEAIALVEKYHGPIPSQELPPDVVTVEPPQMGERRVELRRPAQLPFLFASYHVPEATHPDMPAIELAANILSAGESSRIYNECVYESQVARFAGGYVLGLKDLGLRDPGLFVTYIGVNSGKTMEEAEASLFSVIDKLAEEGPTERELQKVKNILEADFYFGNQTVASKASTLGDFIIQFKGDYSKINTMVDEYRKVTVEDVQRVVKKYMRPINRTVLTVVPDNNADPVDFAAEGGE